jgi:hypothetical protein
MPAALNMAKSLAKLIEFPATWYIVFLLLVALTFSPRINPEPAGDAATFFLMSSDVAAGHLPYFYLWDNKPPLFFLMVGGLMSVLGDEFFVLRLFSATCILITAFITFSVCRLRCTVAGSGLAVGSALAVNLVFFHHPLTEHLAVVFLMASLWLVLAHREEPSTPFLVGILLSLSTLTRTNIGYVVIALGFYYALDLLPGTRYAARYALGHYILGGILPLAAISFAYFLAGDLRLFIVSAFAVPLRYSTEGVPFNDAIFTNLKNLWNGIRLEPLILGSFAALLVAGLTSFFMRWYEPATDTRIAAGNASWLTLMFAVATVVSVLKSGTTFEHYWMQVLPFGAIFVAFALTDNRHQYLRLVSMVLAVVSILDLAVRLIPAALPGTFTSHSPSTLQQAASLIAGDRKDGDQVFVIKDSMIYYYLRQRPPSRIIHPSLFGKEAVMSELAKYGYTDADEFGRILKSSPAYVVTEKDTNYFKKKPQQAVLEATLASRYFLWKQIGYIKVYKRL